ncbi:hypothetical protein Fmac_018280 [Flemingia macrophylla]|uniref:EIF3F/CSN6-like C-terminal domain-containing protein n=1 Tax=Flemingia macrophylla TaxID=520843 RepID=A0ABD1M4J0_9FABA
MAKKRKLRTSYPDPAKPIEPTQEDQETAELHHPQPQPPQQQQPEPTPQDPNVMSLDEPAQEEQHQQQDPEEEVGDEDEEDDLQKPETLEEDQPHTLEAANHDAEANGTEEEEENEDPNLGFQEVRRDRRLQGRHRQGLRQIERLRLYLVQAQIMDVPLPLDKLALDLIHNKPLQWKQKQDVFNLLPNLNVADLIKAFAVKTNDMMLVIYLSSLIRSVIALHNLINNKHEREEDSKSVTVPNAAA